MAQSGLTREMLESILEVDPMLRRFTQDSPVLSDVWREYGRLVSEGKGNERVDLLLSPHRQGSPGELCDCLRKRLLTDAEKKRRSAAPKPSRGFGLTYNDSHVVVRLSLGELIRAALPLTKWWAKYLWKVLGSSERAITVGRLGRQEVRQEIAGMLEAKYAGKAIGGDDILWLVRMVGTLAWFGEKERKADEEPNSAQVVDSLYRLVRGMDTETAVESYTLWLVALNRSCSLSSWKSVVTIKADAAIRLFNLSCKDLTWAIVDSGIDATHPAFGKRTESGQIKPASIKGDPSFYSRVVATYDFNKMRQLMEVPVDDDPAESEEGLVGLSLSAQERAKMQDLRTGLLSGRILDWVQIQPLLRVTPYAPSENEHGTHVAGILAGDWREDDDPEAPQERLPGVCPDMNLYDLRVLDKDGRGDEFSVLAALQFIRYLNSGKDQPVIHGANISMSIHHDVSNYACGRTPICEECERLIASGVVVVAAAGNEGYRERQGGFEASYQDISITDPGNSEGVITVGATHRFKPHTYGVSYFSSRGPTGDGRLKPDLVAPGEKITAPVPGGRAKSLDGSSMAAPHVSGAAALLMACYPELKGEPARIKKILCQSATDLGRERSFQGYGLVDILRALQSV